MADGDFPRLVVSNLPAGHRVELPPFAIAFVRRQMERVMEDVDRLRELQKVQLEASDLLLQLLLRIKERQQAKTTPQHKEAKVIAISSARSARGSSTQRKD